MYPFLGIAGIPCQLKQLPIQDDSFADTVVKNNSYSIESPLGGFFILSGN